MEKLSPAIERTGDPVPCPRCQSSNTKFCYFNNRNFKQPRHYCRGCQRYWTEGGSLRNVPIGAGKRKHKGPHAAPAKPENTGNMFSFYPDQGVYSPSLEQPNVLSFQQHSAHSYGESKPVEMPCAVPQAPFVSESRPQATQAFASLHQKPVSYDAANVAPQASAFVCPRSSEKVGLSEWRNQPSLSLGLNNLAKEANLQQDDAKLVSHSSKDALEPTPSQENVCKPESRPVQHNTERDESTGCSSVTTNLGPSVLEPVEVSNNPEMKSPTMPSQSTSVLNPVVALGASMCPPWLWPFILSGYNAVPPPSFPQVDPTLAATTVGAMASMPPINPAFAAALGAMACSGRLPQIDPNVMAAVSASFLQFPQLWSPYMWGLPWSTAWNTANAVVNAPNGVSKKHPASLDPEQGGASKFAKGEYLREASGSTGMRFAESVKSPKILCSPGYVDACGPKPAASPVKPPVPLQFDMRLDTGQQQVSPHSNPAAQARSAAFQEGN